MAGGYVTTVTIDGVHPILLVVHSDGSATAYEGFPANQAGLFQNPLASVDLVAAGAAGLLGSVLDGITGSQSANLGDLVVQATSKSSQQVQALLNQAADLQHNPNAGQQVELSDLSDAQIQSITSSINSEADTINQSHVPYNYFQQNCETVWKALCDAAGIPANIPTDQNGREKFWPGVYVPFGSPVGAANAPEIYFRYWIDETAHQYFNAKTHTVNTIPSGGGHWETVLLRTGDALKGALDKIGHDILTGYDQIIEQLEDAGQDIPASAPIITAAAKAVMDQRNLFAGELGPKLVGYVVDLTGNQTLDGSAGNQVIVGNGDTIIAGGGDVLGSAGTAPNVYLFGSAALSAAQSSAHSVSSILNYNQSSPKAVVKQSYSNDYAISQGDKIDVSAIVGVACSNGIAASALVRAIIELPLTESGPIVDLQVRPTGSGGWITIANLDGLQFGERLGIVLDAALPAVSVAVGVDPSASAAAVPIALTASTPQVTAGQSVSFTLTMSGPVTVDTSSGAPLMLFNDGTIAHYNAAASNPGGGTLVFDYTYTGGSSFSGQKEVSPDLTVNGIVGNIRDANNVFPNFSVLESAHSGLQTGGAFITSITPSHYGNLSVLGSMVTGQSIQLIVTLSQAVVVDTSAGTPTLVLNNAGSAATYDAAASNPATGRLVFDYTAAPGDHTAALAVTGLSLNGGTIKDSHGTTADFSGAAQTIVFPVLALGFKGTVDVNTPVVASVLPLVGQATVGQKVALSVMLSDDVNVNTSGGLPTLTLNNGATAIYQQIGSDPASGKLVFEYTVGTSQNTAHLAIQSVNIPNGSSINSSDGHAADFTLAINSVTPTQIGPVQAHALPVSPAAVHTGQTVNLEVNLSAAVLVQLGAGAPTLTLSNAAIATYDTIASEPLSGKLVFNYTVGSSDQTPALAIQHINVPDGTTIRDANGVNVDLSGLNGASTGYSVNSPLTVASITSSNSGTVWTLIMSEAVIVDTSTSSRPTLIFNTGTTGTYDDFSSDPSANKLVFRYSPPSGEATADLQVARVILNGHTQFDTTPSQPFYASVTNAGGFNADFSAAIGVSTGVQVTTTSPVLGSVESNVVFHAQDVTTVLSPNLTLVDTGSSLLQSASIWIEGSFPLGDVLAADSTGTAIAWSFDSASGILRLFGADTLANYQKMLRTVTFGTTAVAPADVAAAPLRTIDWQVADANKVSAVQHTQIVFPNEGTGVFSLSPTTDTGALQTDVGHVVTITMRTSAPVIVTGTPVLELNNNAVATYAEGSVSNILTFKYLVQTGDDASDLQVVALSLPSGTSIHDGAGQDLSGAVTGDLGLQIIGTITSNTIQSINQGILRASDSNADASAAAEQINLGQITHASYVDQLINQAQSTTVPALVTFDLFYGKTPSSAGLDFLAAFDVHLAQIGFSLINVWVNLGASFADNGLFAPQYASMTRDAFVDSIYTTVFGHGPTQAAHDVFTNSMDFYATFAGSELGSRGAIAGIMMYLANQDPASNYARAAVHFLQDAAAETPRFESPLVGTYLDSSIPHI